jgi:hypothetical protein
MTGARDMLGTVDLEPAFDIEELATMLQALSDLNRDSTACAAAMIGNDNAGDMVSATRAALDCADIAGTAERVLARGIAADMGVTKAILEAAVAAADRSARECGRHAEHHAHCQLHADSARRVAELGRAELSRLDS